MEASSLPDIKFKKEMFISMLKEHSKKFREFSENINYIYEKNKSNEE